MEFLTLLLLFFNLNFVHGADPPYDVYPAASAETVQYVIIHVRITTTSLLGTSVVDSHPYEVSPSSRYLALALELSPALAHAT